MPVQQAFSFNDLPAVGSSPDAVRTYFGNTYGTTPDGICVNAETYFNAVTPAITVTYGHPCYKTLGDFTYTQASSGTPSNAIVGSQYAVNNGTTDATITLTVTGAWNSSTTVSSESTTGLTLSADFTIEGVFSTGVSFNVSTTAGNSNTTSTDQSASSTVSVTVPAKSKVLVTMVGTQQTATVNFSAPIVVQGYFGANFPNRVDGHYFWFADAASVLPTTTGTITGSISNTGVFNVSTTIGNAEPI